MRELTHFIILVGYLCCQAIWTELFMDRLSLHDPDDWRYELMRLGL
jgi:hypothetical protein